MSGEFAHGAQLKIDNVAVLNLTSIPTPEMTADMLDVTTHNSTGQFREFVGGLKDAGEFTVEGNMISESQLSALVDAFTDSDEVKITIDFNNALATTFECQGFVSGLHPGDNPHDEKRAFSATLKCTGVPTISDGGGYGG